ALPEGQATDPPPLLPIRLDTLLPGNWIKNWAKAVGIEHLGIPEMDIALHQQALTNPAFLALPPTSLVAGQIKIDSSTKFTHDRFLLSDFVHVTLDSGQFQLADSQHQIVWNKVDLALQEGALNIQGAKLLPRPDYDFTHGTHRYAVDLLGLSLSGIGIYDWLVNRQLRVQELRAPSPHIVVVNLPEVDSAAIDSIIKLDLYDLISRELEGFYLDEALFTDISVRVDNQNSRGQFAFNADHGLLWMRGFRIDSVTKAAGRQFDVEKIDLSMDMSGYSLQTPDSSYTFVVRELGVSTVDSSLEARNVRIIPRYAGQASPSKAYVSGHIPSLRVSGIDPLAIYQKRDLHLGKVNIRRPNLLMVKGNQDLDSTNAQVDLYAAVNKVFRSVKIQELQVDSARLYVQNGPAIQDFGVTLQRVKLDSLPLIRPKRNFYADGWTTELGKMYSQSKDSLFGFEIGPVKRLPNKKGWQINQIRIHSLPDQAAFFEANEYARDSLEILLQNIQVPDIDLYNLRENKLLDCGQIKLAEWDVRIWKNRRWPRNPDKRPPNLLETLNSLPLELEVDSLIAQNGRLTYYEKGKFPGQTGYLSIDSLQAVLYNIRSESRLSRLIKNPLLRIRAKGRLMDTAWFAAEYRYPLGDTSSYSFSGNMEGMALPSLNPVLESAAAVRVTKGNLEKMRFQGQSNRKRSRGRMWMHYRDLQVAVIKPVDGIRTKGKKKRFMSAIANSLVVRTNNPKRRFIRVGKIQYQIEPDKSFVGHWIQALLTGVQSSVGLTQKEDKDKSLGLRRLRRKRKQGPKGK
ncbi:MAG: hypothetical protein AAFV07_06500, partial [Bacteroidota bacterium]